MYKVCIIDKQVSCLYLEESLLVTLAFNIHCKVCFPQEPPHKSHVILSSRFAGTNLEHKLLCLEFNAKCFMFITPTFEIELILIIKLRASIVKGYRIVKNRMGSQAWWCTPLSPALRRQKLRLVARQISEFQDSQCYIVRPCLKTSKTTNQEGNCIKF